jgi:hypothetical protein
MAYWKCKRAVKEEIAKKPTKYETDDLAQSIPMIMEVSSSPRSFTLIECYSSAQELGMATQMRNMVYNLYRNADRSTVQSDQLMEPPLPVVEEPLDCVNQARLQWEQGIAQELHVMAAEQGASLCQPQAPADSEASTEGFTSGFGSTTSKAPRFLFDSADLLDAIQRIKSSNRVQTGALKPLHTLLLYTHLLAQSGAVSQGLPQQWGTIKIQLKVPSASDLLIRYFIDTAPPYLINYPLNPLNYTPPYTHHHPSLPPPPPPPQCTKTPTMAELQQQFSALHPQFRQLGLDDVVTDTSASYQEMTSEVCAIAMTIMLLLLSSPPQLIFCRCVLTFCSSLLSQVSFTTFLR